MLAAIATILRLNGTAWFSTRSEPPVKLPGMPLIPPNGFAAMLSIASRTPTEHRAKASKPRRLKNPNGGAETSLITLIH
jgi:hypothetical protein